MKIKEWSVMDSGNINAAIKKVGITIPVIKGWTCDARQRDGFTCDRLENHTGRHAATQGDGTLLAVWS